MNNLKAGLAQGVPCIGLKSSADGGIPYGADDICTP